MLDAVHAQLERRLGALELVALVLELLDLLDQVLHVAVELLHVDAELLRLVDDVGAAREVRTPARAGWLPTSCRIDVLVGLRVALHRGDVHAALVGERALPDERLPLAVLDVGELVDEARQLAQPAQVRRA